MSERPSFPTQREMEKAIRAFRQEHGDSSGIRLVLDAVDGFSIGIVPPPPVPTPPPPKPLAELDGPSVYFLEAPPLTPIKIGFSSGVLSVRMASLQTGCPYKLVPLAVSIPGSRELEGTVHAVFGSDRLTGEWFERSDRLMALIEAIRRGEKLHELIKRHLNA